jgi:hypothetical protein
MGASDGGPKGRDPGGAGRESGGDDDGGDAEPKRQCSGVIKCLGRPHMF